MDAAYVGVGAVCGALCRYQIGNVATRKIAESRNLKYLQGWHTAGINISGSFILGFLGGLPTVDGKSAKGITHGTRLLFGVGFCGSFTTYSTYAVDVVGMLSKGEVFRGVSYMALNNVGAITAGLLGFKFAAKVLGR